MGLSKLKSVIVHALITKGNEISLLLSNAHTHTNTHFSAKILLENTFWSAETLSITTCQILTALSLTDRLRCCVCCVCVC